MRIHPPFRTLLLALVLVPAAASAQDDFGACCFDDFTCMILPLADCYAAPGARFWAGGIGCDPDPCQVITPDLACCRPDGFCVFMNVLDCEDTGGLALWWGGCDPNPCDQQLQACCLSDGTCDLLLPSVCLQVGGEPAAPDFCQPNPCGGQIGACCLVSAGCVLLAFEDCYAIADSYAWLDEPSCSPDPCPNTPMVACCYPDGHCERIPEFVCVSEGGTSAGYWIDCDPDPCAPSPVEGGSWGRLKTRYR